MALECATHPKLVSMKPLRPYRKKKSIKRTFKLLFLRNKKMNDAI